MDIFKAYATDESKENEGVWQEVGDARFLVARSGNHNYVKKMTKLLERHQKVLDRKDDAAEKLSENLMIDVAAETLLLDWENVQFKGKDLPYSLDNAKMLLAFKDFRRQVLNLADEFEAYRAEQEAEAVKN